jgi:hypothetical protein
MPGVRDKIRQFNFFGLAKILLQASSLAAVTCQAAGPYSMAWLSLIASGPETERLLHLFQQHAKMQSKHLARQPNGQTNP